MIERRGFNSSSFGFIETTPTPDGGEGGEDVGGGYQTAGTPCTIVTSGLHTIMIARVDNAAMTEEELALFANMFVIVVA